MREFLETFVEYQPDSYMTIFYRLATYDEAITGLLVILLIQWYVIRCPRIHLLNPLFMDRFFAWRFWQIGRSTLWIGFRIVIVAVLVVFFFLFPAETC
jgi:hypothetical protein